MSFTALLLIATMAQSPTQAGSSTPTPAPPPSPAPEEKEPATIDLRVSIDKGLSALARMQVEDGSFGDGRYDRHAGVTALSGLAFMADGNLPDRGRYAPQVRRTLDFLLEHVQPSGLVAAETSHGPMYGHGFATLLLAEIYGSSHRDTDVHDALSRAIDLIVRTQNEEGGWRYQPVPADADVSVTIC